MEDELTSKLLSEIKAFDSYKPASAPKTVSDAYGRVLNLVQTLMLTNGHSDAHARVWNLINEDAFKDLSDFEGGNRQAITDLKHKIGQVGDMLSND